MKLFRKKFHSGEDKLVTHRMRAWERENDILYKLPLLQPQTGKGRLLTKQPIIPTKEEIKENPRARSARLRVFEYQKNYQEAL